MQSLTMGKRSKTSQKRHENDPKMPNIVWIYYIDTIPKISSDVYSDRPSYVFKSFWLKYKNRAEANDGNNTGAELSAEPFRN